MGGGENETERRRVHRGQTSEAFFVLFIRILLPRVGVLVRFALCFFFSMFTVFSVFSYLLLCIALDLGAHKNTHRWTARKF